MLRDVAMGKLRREAMTELAERIGVDELTNFINSIIQAEQLGVGIAQVLRVQSDQTANAPAAAGGADRARGADQDDLPAGAVHLPGVPARHPGTGGHPDRNGAS